MKLHLGCGERYLDGYNVHYAGNPYITGEVPKLIRNDASKKQIQDSAQKYEGIITKNSGKIV